MAGSDMKTPEEWMEIVLKRGDQTQPAGTLRFILQVQADALKCAADLCEKHAASARPEGWTDSVARECASIINLKRDDILTA